MKKITQDTTVAEILKVPGAEETLAKYKLPCLWCPMAKLEIENLKIGRVCRVYNIDVEKLLKELNEIQAKCKTIQGKKKSKK